MFWGMFSGIGDVCRDDVGDVVFLGGRFGG